MMKTLAIVVTLTLSWAKPIEYYPSLQKTREVLLKQGKVQGVVVQLRNYSLPPVEVYRGIPYAAPPVGDFRFMPPSSVSTWDGVRFMDEFQPVCPQKFPDESTMSTQRKKYVNRLKQFLRDQNEDCLYLNIYAPYQDDEPHSRTYPVIVFLHGESFEWNSGNPYDGSVLSSFGQVIVVTLNFRLGILGFLKVEQGETTRRGNFGMVDQVAALLWIKTNIAAFGGDPGKVTLLGHGTGAAFASLLTISPMARTNEQLFHRAILMSGTALADWALVAKPLDVSIQIAQILNCPLRDNFAACLRNKRLDELMAAAPITEKYETTFGPVVDGLVVPNDPKMSMKEYKDIFRRFELMYGVTEMESLHLALGGDVTLTYGLLDKEKDEELRKYMRTKCEMKPEACFAGTRAQYNYGFSFQHDQAWMNEQPPRATIARDELLDILSDARTVAPIIQTGLYHSAVNIQSYFYVFAHKTHSREYIRNKTYTGEELPYVFGVPIEGPKFHFQDVSYTEDEKRLSMTIMQYFSNFAYTGNPEVPKMNFADMDYSRWHQFDKEWLPFDQSEQNYLKLDVPITNGRYYRSKQAEFWNDIFPNISSKNPLPWNWSNPKGRQDIYENFNKSDVFGTIRRFGNRSSNEHEDTYGYVVTAAPEEIKQSSPTVSVLVVLGVVFLLANIAFFTFLYIKCIRNKKPSPSNTNNVDNGEEDKNFMSNCNIVRMLSREQKNNTYDAVHDEPDNAKAKLTRAMSNSTIDAHAKVREWITNEIALKYSPKADKRPQKQRSLDQLDIDTTPTRPVSPAGPRPLLIKTASIDRSNKRKNKVSVAIDATPSGRGPSVLMQQPIELTKSLDCPRISPTPLRRSVTLEDFTELSSNINNIETKPTIVRIEHGHSRSDPVQDLDYGAMRRLRTFDPNCDVNVTSRDDVDVLPMTPEEALLTIKRRNYPKVLPDHPGRQAFLSKRRSMPVHNLYTEERYNRFPPVPPPRTTTLGRQGSNPQPVCLSEPTLVEEASSPEPEEACNDLYVGPLIPRNDKKRAIPRAVVTANGGVKRSDPRVVVRPTISKNKSAEEPRHPRVVVPDNKPEIYAKPVVDKEEKKGKKSQIPVKSSNTSLNKDASSSESPCSLDSDTGTVVKRV